MAANTTPIFSRVGDDAWGNLTTANTAFDGTGTVLTLYTADATNGGLLGYVRALPFGTNVASVARFFLNNGSTNTVAANNSLLYELSLPAISVSQVAAQNPLTWPAALPMPPGYRILVTIGTTVAAGWQFTAIASKY